LSIQELTMAAYKAAIDDGADGFECDVRLTKDNQLVLWHDADMKRVAGKLLQLLQMHTYLKIKQHYPHVITLEELLSSSSRQQKRVSD